MKKAVLIPLLLPLLVYAAVKGFIWFKVQKAAEYVQQRIQPFATLEYDRVESTILTRGPWSAALVGVQVRPSGSAFPVHIERIALSSSRESWLYILQQGTPLDKGQLPDQAQLDIRGISVDMEAPMMQQLMLLAPATAGQGSTAGGAAWMGCQLDAQQRVSLMGRYLLTDIGLSYQFDPQSEYANLEFELALKQLFSTRMRVDVDLGTAVLNRKQWQQLQPRLGGLSLHYQDQGYTERFIHVCAELNDESEAAFIERHLTELNSFYQALGLQYPPNLIDAYRQFLQQPGQFSLGVDLPQAVTLETLNAKPGALLDKLNIRLSINGQTIDTSAFGWDPTAASRPQSRARPGALAETLTPAESAAATEQRPGSTATQGVAVEYSGPRAGRAAAESAPAVSTQSEPAEPEPSFQRTRLTELQNYLGFEVRLATHNGRQISGKIARIDNERMLVRQSLSGGTADLPVRFDHIRLAEVKR